jgi:hypothetical protein
MKPAAKYSLIVVGILVITVPVLYALAVTYALKLHWEEDSIVLGGKQVEYAINDYIQKHGSPPPKLENLAPECISAMPVFPQASNVHYSIAADGHGWTLDIYRPRNNTPLIYRRTNVGLSLEDARRTVHTENGCYVLRTR